jgi:hypothetical protein
VQEGGDEKKKRETRKRDDHEHSPARVQGKWKNKGKLMLEAVPNEFNISGRQKNTRSNYRGMSNGVPGKIFSWS